MKYIFEEIYRQHIWFDAESSSGPGSNLAQTSTVREILSSVLKEFNIKTILDIQCGDFNWTKEVDLPTCSYYGADIVSDIVHHTKERYGSSTLQFFLADDTQSSLPHVDLIFCRDCLVNFSNVDIAKAVANIKKSLSTFLQTTTFTTWLNLNIRTGAWRSLNVQAYPFLFPMPLQIMKENCTEINDEYPDKSLRRIDSLPDLSFI